MVLPAPANQAIGPSGPSAREIELERELAEERGRVAELRAQLAKVEAEQIEAVAEAVADAVSKVVAKQSVKLPAALERAMEKLIKQAGAATEQLAVAGSAAAEMTGEAVGQTKALLREAPGYHRDLLHALRAVEIAGEWMRQQFQPQAEPLKLVADIDGAPPVLTAAATAKAKPRAKAAQRTRTV